jgi:hypothetical protein
MRQSINGLANPLERVYWNGPRGRVMKISYANRIRARIVEIEAILASRDKLRDELEELRVAERVILRLGTENEDDGSGGRVQPRTKSPGSMTTKDHILAVLLEAEEVWITTLDVQSRTSKLVGRDVPIGTIAPTLSELRKLELIVRDGPKVAHADRLKKNETPASAEAPKNPSPDESGTSMQQSGGASTPHEEKGVPRV